MPNGVNGSGSDRDRFPIHADTAQQVAYDAVRRAKAYGTRRGWRATQRLQPLWSHGRIGIRDPLKFLVYQDKGTRPRVMWNLEGKTIPIGVKNNTTPRFIKVKGVGQPGWVTLPGGVKVFRQQKWKHPGIKPTHFLQNAINEAIQNATAQMRQAIKDRHADVEPSYQSGDYFA
jgi:hypothetical protein